jgi:hypothetical protein
MGKPNLSAELPEITLRQLEELKPLFNGNKTQVVIRAIAQLHKQEIGTMNTDTQTITIENIATKPEHDPYTNIEGVVSKTTLKLDPRDRTVWVTQEYNDNSTLMDEWNGLVLTWGIPGHPSENGMREWINERMTDLTTICDGFEAHWNGNNIVGRLTDEARGTKESLEFLLDQDAGPANYYETWTVDSWLEMSLDEITADMTDEQLKEFADGVEPDSSTIVEGDILKYITDHRDNLKWEQDNE